MADPDRSSSSSQNPGPPQEFYDPQDYHPREYYHLRDYHPQADHPQFDRPQFDRPQFDRPQFDRPQFDRPQFDRPQFDRPQSGDLAPQQQSIYYPGMNSTSMPSYTEEPRHVVLPGQPPTFVTLTSRPPAPAPQVDRDFFQSNYPLSYFAEIASQQPRLPTGNSIHQEYQQGQLAWRAAPPAGSQPHQQIRTAWQGGSLPPIDWWPHHLDMPGPHVPPGSSRVRPPAEQEHGRHIMWTDDMNEYVLQQGAKVVAVDQSPNQRYRWNDFAKDFPTKFPGINPAPTNLKNRFYHLRREAQEKEQEAR